jgi:hypothetical protein
MSLRQAKEDDEGFLMEGPHPHVIERALLFVLFGSVFLALARFLQWPGGAEARLWARIIEVVGWSGLVSSTAVLSVAWRFNKKHQTRHPQQDSLRQRIDSKSTAKPVRDRWGRLVSATNAAGSEAIQREEAIDRLYSELRPLLSRAATDPSLKEEAQRKLSLLRKLQDEEADEIQRRFEASFLLKPGEGRRALDRADEILARYEDPSSAHAPAQQKD